MKKLFSFFFLLLIATTASASGVYGSIIDPTARARALPTGAVYDFAGTSCPSGSLIVPTTAGTISRTTYAELFAAIGTTWGVGDGSTTFGRPYLPADNTTVQANANVGTATDGIVKSHSHGIRYSAAPLGNPTHLGIIDSSTLGVVDLTVGFESKLYGGSQNLPAGIRFLKCVKY